VSFLREDFGLAMTTLRELTTDVDTIHTFVGLDGHPRPSAEVSRVSRHSLIATLTATTLIMIGCSTNSEEGGSTDNGDAADLFDSTVVHDISVEFDTDDYDALIEELADTGEKTWMEATVTIDGTAFENVGMRLKGNSSLAGFGGGGGPGGFGGGGGPGGVGGSSAEEPESLPWLIRLDEFVDGQSYQGYEDIVVRSNGSATALNEAVALDLFEEAGLASQQAASTSFTVNGGEPTLRLAMEHPDDDAWQEASFEEDGALYKAESTGDWSYRGDDPDEYTEVFDQEGGSDLTDLSPLIEFLEFLNESDDATFASELPDRLDVDSFATYLAMMDLVANFDDIDGPGNNAYVWYDLTSEQFTIVPWDMNLAFGAFGGGGGGAQPPGGFDPGQLPEGFDPDELPEGFDQGQIPEGFDPGELPEGFEPPAGGGGGPGGGGPGGGNVLVERFHENEELEALYQTKLEDLRASLYDSGVAADILQAWTDTLVNDASGLVDPDTVDEEAAAIAEQFGTDE